MDTKSFGEKLAYGRQNQKLTQEELAVRLSITPQALSKWERGISLPSVELLADICRVLQISADELLQTSQKRVTENGDVLQEKEVLNSLEVSESLVLLVGSACIEMIMEGLKKDLIHKKRVELAGEGILLPILRIRDSLELKPTEIRVLSYQKLLLKEEVEEIKEDTFSYIVDKIAEIVRNTENYAYILNREMVKTLIERTAKLYPTLIQETVPIRIPYGYLLRVLRKLLLQGIIPKNLNKIIEIMDEYMEENLSAEEMAEVVLRKL